MMIARGFCGQAGLVSKWRVPVKLLGQSPPVLLAKQARRDALTMRHLGRTLSTVVSSHKSPQTLTISRQMCTGPTRDRETDTSNHKTNDDSAKSDIEDVPRESAENPGDIIDDVRDREIKARISRTSSLQLNKEQLLEKQMEKARKKETFKKAIAIYLDHQTVQRRGMVEFVYASLEKMKQFGVNRDLDAYKQLIDLFPKEKMVLRSVWHREMMYFPKQQFCLIDILDHMEDNGVMPDDEMGYQILEIFGKDTYPFRKYQRMMYWMPKFKYANPYYIPHNLPDDNIELAKLALERMAVDLENTVSVFDACDIESSMEDTFVVSAQSPLQCSLIASHPVDVPLYVEGGFTTWLRDQPLTYFVLRGEQSDTYKAAAQTIKEADTSDGSDARLNSMFTDSSSVVVRPSVHEQDEGTILGMCITGTSSKDSLITWTKALQQVNPSLQYIPIIFMLRSPAEGLQVYQEEEESAGGEVLGDTMSHR